MQPLSPSPFPASAGIREALLDALAVLLPVECAGCGTPDRSLCADCRAALVPAASASRDVGALRVDAALRYEDVVRSTLLVYKTEPRIGLARALAPALAAAIRTAVAADAATWGEDAPLDLVAVPSTRAARRRRGFDPVPELLARAGHRSLRVFAPARRHRAQKGLDRDEREENLAGVFRLRRPVVGRRILLVDDVVTTGATLRAAARTLRDGGAEVVGAAVVASTPRRRDVSQRTRGAGSASTR